MLYVVCCILYMYVYVFWGPERADEARGGDGEEAEAARGGQAEVVISIVIIIINSSSSSIDKLRSPME